MSRILADECWSVAGVPLEFQVQDPEQGIMSGKIAKVIAAKAAVEAAPTPAQPAANVKTTVPWCLFRDRLAGGILVCAWRGTGERENRSGKQQRVRKIVEPFNLHSGARVGDLHDQDRPIDEEDQQENPGTEISCRHPRLLAHQNTSR